MPYYRQVGRIPPKRHTVFSDDDGHRYSEQLMGQEGFSSRSALLYHRHSPSAITAIEPLDDPVVGALSADNPLTPRHVQTSQVKSGDDIVTGRRLLLGNADVRIAWARSAGPSTDGPLYRNATGDELIYVQEGTAVIESVFGRLQVGPGDYVVMPASTTHRWRHDADLAVLIIETSGHVAPPRRYLSTGGQFLEHAPYCERDLRAPTEPLVEEGENVEVVVRNRAGLSRHVHRTHPRRMLSCCQDDRRQRTLRQRPPHHAYPDPRPDPVPVGFPAVHAQRSTGARPHHRVRRRSPLHRARTRLHIGTRALDQ